MDSHYTKFIITGKDSNTREENLIFLRDACCLAKGRWGAVACCHEDPTPYATITFDKYQIGRRKFLDGLGDLQWLLTIQKVQDGMTDTEAISYLLLVQKYNVQPSQTSEQGEEETGYPCKTQSYSQVKRRRN